MLHFAISLPAPRCAIANRCDWARRAITCDRRRVPNRNDPALRKDAPTFQSFLRWPTWAGAFQRCVSPRFGSAGFARVRCDHVRAFLRAYLSNRLRLAHLQDLRDATCTIAR